MPGPKKLPTNLKLIRGTSRQDRDGRPVDRVMPKPAAQLEPPFWIDGVAAETWRKVAPELERLQILAEVDEESLAGYCLAAQRIRECEAEIVEHGIVIRGEGIPRKNPAVAAQFEAMQKLRLFAVEFGLTPSARSGMWRTPRMDSNAKTASDGKASAAGRLLD